jgi:hypothetical protein
MDFDNYVRSLSTENLSRYYRLLLQNGEDGKAAVVSQEMKDRGRPH